MNERKMEKRDDDMLATKMKDSQFVNERGIIFRSCAGSVVLDERRLHCLRFLNFVALPDRCIEELRSHLFRFSLEGLPDFPCEDGPFVEANKENPRNLQVLIQFFGVPDGDVQFIKALESVAVSSHRDDNIV